MKLISAVTFDVSFVDVLPFSSVTSYVVLPLFLQNYAPNFAPNFFKNDINQHTYLIKTKCLTIQKNKIKNPSKALFQAIKGFERLEEPNDLDDI